MKTISKQYQALLEGKMSRDNFVRNCRQQFPQFISPVTSIDDAIKILKSKRIIGESTVIDTNMNQDAEKEGYQDNNLGYSLEDCPYPTGSVDAELWKDGWMQAESEKQYAHDQETHRSETDDMWTDPAGGTHYGDEEDPAAMYKESLNEAAEKTEGKYKEVTSKDQYGRFKDIDNVNYTTFLRAVAYECGKQADMADDLLPAILEKVAKKMRKDPNAYRELVIANYADIAKQDELLKMVPVNGKNRTDADNAMEKVKGQETPKATPSSNKENKKGKPKGVKEMGITPKKAKGITSVMDMPGKEKVLDTLKESLKKNLKEDTHYKYNKGSRAVTPEGEGSVVEVMGGTITVEFADGKQKDYQVNTLNYFEKQRSDQFMPAVNIGASFDKMKTSMGDESKFEDLMKKYDWYAEMSDDSRKYRAQKDMEYDLKVLAKSIGAEKATEIWNRYAPQDRKINAKFFTMTEKKDKYAKLKEFLKKAIKEKKAIIVPKGANDQQKLAAMQKAGINTNPGASAEIIEK